MRWFGSGRGGPRTVDGAVRRALLAVLGRDLAEAEDLLTQAARIDSEAIEVYLALGRIHRSRGQIDRAIRIHQNLLLRPDLDPQLRCETVAELAADFHQGGFLRRALASYQEVLAYEPRHHGALVALVELHAAVRQFSEAIEMHRRLTKLEKRDPDEGEARLLVTMAEAAREEGRSQDARRVLKRAVRRDPKNVRAWIVLGDLAAERSNTRGALAAWRRVPDLDRRAAVDVYPRLESAFAASGQLRRYEDFLRELLTKTPDDRGARLALAQVLAGRGASDEAVGELRTLLDRESDDLEVRAILGRILLADRRDPEIAKEYAEFLGVIERNAQRLARRIQE